MSLFRFGYRHWLTARFFFPLVLASGVALALFIGWHLRFGGWPGPRLHVNLGLAWVPYLCSLWAAASAEHSRHSLRSIIVPGMIWLLFFPNAPYLITDWLYVEDWSTHLWYSIALFTAFSSCGLLLAIVSLYLMHALVTIHLGRIAGWGMVGLAVVLSGLGVYMGRFLRLNSWSLITQPSAVLEGMANLSRGGGHVGPISFTVMFTVLLLPSYYVFLAVRRAPWSREEELLARGFLTEEPGRSGMWRDSDALSVVSPIAGDPKVSP